jgi:prophage maintenance system killer protein
MPSEDPPRQVRYLAYEHILTLHDLVLRPDEDNTILDDNLVRSVAIRPQTAYFGQEQYPDLFVKAGCMVESLAGLQMFYTGNKRTAWEVGRVFLLWNGYRLARMTWEKEEQARYPTISRLLDEIAEKIIVGPDQVSERLRLYYEPVDADEQREALRKTRR